MTSKKTGRHKSQDQYTMLETLLKQYVMQQVFCCITQINRWDMLTAMLGLLRVVQIKR